MLAAVACVASPEEGAGPLLSTDGAGITPFASAETGILAAARRVLRTGWLAA